MFLPPESDRSVSAKQARPRPDPHRVRERMIRELREQGITDENVLRAMGIIHRHLFVDEALAARAYDLTSLPLGLGQTISNPLTVARMTELLELQAGMRVLEIGTGSGYQAAVLAEMGCFVYTVERLPLLHEKAKKILRELGYARIRMMLGDGTMGYRVAAPYARIIVTAGGPSVPEPLLKQLDEKGIMLIPVGEAHSQRLLRITRRGSSFVREDFGPASFVDLVGNHGW